LIASNGDQELWQTLCHFDNPSPVRALFRTSDNWEQLIATPEAFYGRAEYPATAPVGDQHGNVSAGIASGNIFPWCFKINSERDAAEVSSHTVNGQPIPVCPPEVLAESNHWLGDVNGARPPEGDYRDDHRRWTTRGAVNAGLAVFLNLREISLGHAVPKPRYDECERLAGTATN